MASLLGRALAYRRSPHFKRMAKFLSVSVISTIVTQVVLFFTYHEWHVATAMESNVIATACATVPAYWLNRTWTWGKTGKSHLWREIVPFWSIAFIGLVLSTAAVGVAAHNADHLSRSKDVQDALVQLANFVTYGCIWVGRYAIFNRYLFGERTQQPRPADRDRNEEAARRFSELTAEQLVAGQAEAAPALLLADDQGSTGETPRGVVRETGYEQASQSQSTFLSAGDSFFSQH